MNYCDFNLENFSKLIYEDLPIAFNHKENLLYLKLYRDGNLKAKDDLILHNLRLVKKTIFKFFPYVNLNSEIEDMFSIGVIELYEAIEKYDFNRKAHFSSFAIICIRNGIINYLNQNKKFYLFKSLQENIITYDNGVTLTREELLEDSNNVIELAFKKLLVEEILDLFYVLTEQEQNVIKLYIGLDAEPLTYKEIGKIFNFSIARAQFIYKSAILKLYKAYNRSKILKRKKSQE